MASAAALPPPRRADTEGGALQQLWVGKRRPRPAETTPTVVVPRQPINNHKWALLEREQELERRRVEEVSEAQRIKCTDNKIEK